MSGNFTFPTKAKNRFIVADQVNVTWHVDAPVISLYESCDQRNNNHSYVWTATRKGYVESGCKFMLQPFTADHEAYGNNITSVLFGVSKRYTDDPAPASYNFVNESSSSPTTETESPTSSATTGSSQPTTTTPTSHNNQSHGLSKASKIGIGLGFPLGVLLVAAIAVGALIIYRRKSRRKGDVTREITATSPNQPSDGLGALPTFAYKDHHQTRLSQAETIGSSSQLSTDNQRTERAERPPSELMSTERAELV